MENKIEIKTSVPKKIKLLSFYYKYNGILKKIKIY